MNDPTACAICSTPLGSTELENYGLWHWDPAADAVKLVQLFCPEHRPLPAPDWIRQAAHAWNDVRDAPLPRLPDPGQQEYRGRAASDGRTQG